MNHPTDHPVNSLPLVDALAEHLQTREESLGGTLDHLIEKSPHHNGDHEVVVRGVLSNRPTNSGSDW